jgi:hypothetical protein
MSEPYILCLKCRAVHTDEQVEGSSACPTCGDRGLPGNTRKKSTLTLTHHEWRVLFMWATRWATDVCAKSDREGHDSPALMEALVREAKRQAPELPSLTLMGDVQDVANALGAKAEVHGADGVVEVKPETKH